MSELATQFCDINACFLAFQGPSRFMRKLNKLTSAIATFTTGFRWKNRESENKQMQRSETKHKSMVSLHKRKDSRNENRFSTGAIENWPAALANANSRDTSIFVQTTRNHDGRRARRSVASEEDTPTFMEFTTKPRSDLLDRDFADMDTQYNSRKIPFQESPLEAGIRSNIHA
jgi:hypothetical protein